MTTAPQIRYQGTVHELQKELMGCRTPEGVPLTGPTCIGRAVLAGGGRVGNVRTCVGCDGWWMDVDLSHSPVPVDGGPGFLAIEIRRDPR